MQRLGPTKKKGKREEVSVLIVLATGLSLCTEQRVDFVQEMVDWSVKADHPQRSQFHPKNLFLSLNLWCKDLVPQKKRKRKSSECVDCFSHWTVFMHWTESGLCTRDGWIRTDPQRGQFLPTNLFPGLICDAKTWSHKKKKRKRICGECVYCFGHGTVFMHQTESGLCTRDGWLRADPQRS